MKHTVFFPIRTNGHSMISSDPTPSKTEAPVPAVSAALEASVRAVSAKADSRVTSADSVIFSTPFSAAVGHNDRMDPNEVPIYDMT